VARHPPGTEPACAAMPASVVNLVFDDKITNAATTSRNPASDSARNQKAPRATARSRGWRRMSR